MSLKHCYTHLVAYPDMMYAVLVSGSYKADVQ